MSYIPDRFLGITSMWWRLGLQEAISQLRDWIAIWAPLELVGGLANRDARTLHIQMFQDLDEAQSGDRTFAGFKADLRKCFTL